MTVLALTPQNSITPYLGWTLSAVYLMTLGVLSVYSLHRLYLIVLYFRHRPGHESEEALFEAGEDAPWVTVQLPLFNEFEIAEQIIRAASELDYPKARLQIQVLDDSTDLRSREIARECVAHYRSQGFEIELYHREQRTGFKAGALREATAHAKAEFIVIFDADFLPKRDFLKRTLGYFEDERVGFIQTRWAHLNRDDSLLTQCQAIFLDSHFVIEHTARYRAGHWINFNGTAGVWRKSAILDAGNWQGDTLTEDVDLSYRAQLREWRSVYLPDVTCPSQIPPEINAFKSQQHRWAKGSIQSARKLLPEILKAKIPFGTKVEAFFHLTGPIVYVCATLLTLLLYPTLVYAIKPIESPILGFSILFLALFSAMAYFIASQAIQRRPVLTALLRTPALFAIGIAIAFNNARGVIEAMLNIQSDFIRTPKYTAEQAEEIAKRRKAKATLIPTPTIKTWMAGLEIVLGLYMLLTTFSAIERASISPTTPLLFIFAMGYLYVGYFSLINLRGSKKVVEQRI